MNIMKKLGLFLIAVIFTLSLQAKDILAQNVPANVRAYISKNYPSANYIEWELKDNGAYYKAEFKMDGREAKVKISNNGKLISAKEDMLIKDIPPFATSYVKKNYNDAEILGANKSINSSGETTYNVGIRFTNDRGYDRHRNIVFDSKGNLIRK